MKKTNRLFLGISYFYILCPFLIFLIGWCRWYIAAPGVLIILYGYMRLIRNMPSMWEPEWTGGNIEKAVFIFLIIAFWVYLSGTGKFVFQNTDHEIRNAIFETMVKEPWPIVKSVEIDGVLTERGLVYYIGFWLPSALAGKVFGVSAGYCFQAAWAVLGICCVYYLICVLRKRIQIWPLVVFIFISGLDAVMHYIVGGASALEDITKHLEWWPNVGWQFSSFTTQLFWVFNQALPAWLLTLLLYIQKDNKRMIFLLSCAMLTSTLPFVGMLPFVCFFMIRNTIGHTFGERLRNFVADTFTPENILGGGLIGILSFLYLIKNAAIGSENTVNSGYGVKSLLFIWVTFFLLEAGVYLLAVYKYQKRNVLFYLIGIWLAVCPLVTVGKSTDFCMRASIPALLLLYLLVIEALEKSKNAKDYLTLGALVVVLALGSITPVHEFARTVAHTAMWRRSGDAVYAKTVPEENLFKGMNFSGDIEDSFFYQYIAR